MHKKFEIKRTKIKGGCQSEGKVVTHNSKSASKIEKYAEATLSAKYCSTFICGDLKEFFSKVFLCKSLFYVKYDHF